MAAVWIVLIAAVVAMLLYAVKRLSGSFKDRIAKVNREQRLDFPVTPILGSWVTGMVFDRQHRKALYLNNGKAEVLDYGYFTRWVFRWDMRRNGSVQNRRIVIDTKDFDRPQMEFVMGSDTEGQQWVARLDVLFNRE